MVITCTGTISSDITGKDILDSIKKAKELLYDGPPLIKVWIGKNDWMPKTDYPLIRESSYLDKDMCYVVAGLGVIAGKNAYKKLWDIGYIAVWDENPPN